MSTTILTLIAIWGLSALLSFPLIFAMDMKVVAIPHILMNMVGDSAIAYCAEEWGEYKRGRLFYSIFSLVVQVIMDQFHQSFYKQLLHIQIPSAQKDTDDLTVFFHSWDLHP